MPAGIIGACGEESVASLAGRATLSRRYYAAAQYWRKWDECRMPCIKRYSFAHRNINILGQENILIIK